MRAYVGVCDRVCVRMCSCVSAYDRMCSRVSVCVRVCPRVRARAYVSVFNVMCACARIRVCACV